MIVGQTEEISDRGSDGRRSVIVGQTEEIIDRGSDGRRSVLVC